MVANLALQPGAFLSVVKVLYQYSATRMKREEQAIMSQQMESDEANRGYAGSREAGSEYYSGQYGQRIGFVQSHVSSSPSAGMRLALAIVSLCVLIPLTGIVAGVSASTGSPLGLFGGLIALAIICLTIIVVNIAFNWRH